MTERASQEIYMPDLDKLPTKEITQRRDYGLVKEPRYSPRPSKFPTSSCGKAAGERVHAYCGLRVSHGNVELGADTSAFHEAWAAAHRF